MFGDNLSFISDTTIAACQGQGCQMKDKFRENFKIAYPRPSYRSSSSSLCRSAPTSAAASFTSTT